MPFKSKAQRRFMYANYPKIAKRWSKHTPKGKDLPEHVEESLTECYDFKNVVVTDNKSEASVFFTLTEVPRAELGLIFTMHPEIDYQYGVIRDLSTKEIHKFNDPQKATKLLKGYGLTPEDVEGEMYQRAYEEIESYDNSSKVDDGVQEESLQFEALFAKIIAS